MNIYISNLGHTITEESLRTAFATYGKVLSSKIITDGFTGYSRGFAFVDMPDDSEAALAIEKMNGRVIDGQIISVQKARPQITTKSSNLAGNRSRK